MLYHYSHKLPLFCFAYNVYNDKNEWCGVICYGRGANPNIAKAYGLNQGEVLELVRVALNGKQETTSKAVAVSLKLVKKDCPTVKLIVSYADEAQGHKGIIYKASNWIYVGDTYSYSVIDPSTGKLEHARSMNLKYKGIKHEPFKRVTTDKPKHKYIYILDKRLCVNSLKSKQLSSRQKMAVQT